MDRRGRNYKEICKVMRKLCQAIAGIMILMMAGMGESEVWFLFVWLIVANIFMYLGKGFSFQQKIDSNGNEA